VRPEKDEEGNVWEIRNPDEGARPAYERRPLLRTAQVLEEASRRPGSVRGILCVLMLDADAEPREIFGETAAENDLYVAFFGSVAECSAVAMAAFEELSSDQAA
jgi:hypothetical protein